MSKARMNQEPNDRKHLSPRQIINRYRKGEYVDESIEAISSAISSCNQTFDSIAVPFPTTIVEKICENLAIAKTLYESQKKGKSFDSIVVPDYPQLYDILTNLSYPPLWESMIDDKLDVSFIDIMKERGISHKYMLDYETASSTKVVNSVSYTYREAIEQTGLSFTTFGLVLHMLFK